MKNLKRLRKRAGLTLTQLAQAADVNAAVIIRMEAGRQRSAIYETVVRLARALGVTPDELHDPVPRRKRRRAHHTANPIDPPAAEPELANGGGQ